MSKIYGIGDEEELAEDLQKEIPDRIIKELEKIKTEMIEKCKEYRWDNDDVVSDSLIRIIDNHISKLKGENKECPYFDYEVGTCRRSETEFDELNNLYYGMTDSMQKAVKDIMLVANGKEIEE